MKLEYPLEVYIDKNFRENYLKHIGTFIMKSKKIKLKEYKLDAQGVLDLTL